LRVSHLKVAGCGCGISYFLGIVPLGRALDAYVDGKRKHMLAVPTSTAYRGGANFNQAQTLKPGRIIAQIMQQLGVSMPE